MPSTPRMTGDSGNRYARERLCGVSLLGMVNKWETVEIGARPSGGRRGGFGGAILTHGRARLAWRKGLRSARPIPTSRSSPWAQRDHVLERCGAIHTRGLRSALRAGVPSDAPRRGWACGFYPGTAPGEYLASPRRSMKPARRSRRRGRSWRPPAPKPIIRRGAISATGRRGKTGCMT